MSLVSDLAAGLDRAVLASRQQLLLRVATVGATLGFLWLVPVAGGTPGVISVAALLGVGVLAVALPDSSAPLFLVLGLGWLWWGEVPDRFSGWTLLAAALLLVVHVAATLACYGPPALELPGSLLVTWTGRAAVMLAGAALVWVAGGVLTGLDLPPSATVVVVALALVAGWVTLLLARLVGRDAARS